MLHSNQQIRQAVLSSSVGGRPQRGSRGSVGFERILVEVGEMWQGVETSTLICDSACSLLERNDIDVSKRKRELKESITGP